MPPRSWTEYAHHLLTTNNMPHLTPDQKNQRTADRPYRWHFQRLRRLDCYDRQHFDEPYPVPGLQRLVNGDVRKYASSYYCLVSQSYSETLPPNCGHVPYNGLTYYRAEVFTYLNNNTPDPRIAHIHCLTVRGLRKRVNEALAALEDEDHWGLAPVNEGWCSNLEELILQEEASPAMRLDIFRQLVQKLNVNEATALTRTLLADIKSRKPGQPGYAAQHGLHVDAEA